MFFKNVHWKMVAIWSRPECLKKSVLQTPYLNQVCETHTHPRQLHLHVNPRLPFPKHNHTHTNTQRHNGKPVPQHEKMMKLYCCCGVENVLQRMNGDTTGTLSQKCRRRDLSSTSTLLVLGSEHSGELSRTIEAPGDGRNQFVSSKYH